MDSVIITAHKEILGKEAAIFNHHTLDSEFHDIYDVYYVFENNKIYSLNSFDIEDPNNFWHLWIDFNMDINASITLSDTNYKQFDSFTNADEVGNSKITLKRVANKNIKYNNNDYKCICFMMEINEKGLQISNTDSAAFIRNISILEYFAKDIGFIRSEMHFLEKVENKAKEDYYGVSILLKHHIE